MSSVRTSLLALCVVTTFLTACSSGGGGSSSALPQAAQPTSSFGAASQSRSYPLASAAGTYAIPPLGGFNGSLALPATMVPANTRLQLTTSLQAPAGAPVLGQAAQRRAQDTGTFNVYFYTTIRLSSTIIFPTLPTFSVTLPASLNLTGLQFFYAISNPTPTNGAKVQFGTEGPATVAGHVVTFAPSPTPLTFQAGKSYTIAFYAITGIAPTPSPSPMTAKIYVTNSNTRVTSYTANGTQTTQTINTVFLPYSIAVDAAGKIYVAVAKPDLPNDTILMTYTASGTKTTPTIDLGPTAGDIAADAGGNIYVARSSARSTFTGSVTKYNPAGILVKTISRGMLNPFSVAVDANGKIYVANAGANPGAIANDGSVTTYLPDGTQTTPTITGLNTALNVAVDAQGKIYVTSWALHSENGQITTYLANGKQTTPIIITKYPYDVAVDTAEDIYLADYNKNDLEVYNPQGTLINTITAGLFGPGALAVH